MSPWEENLPELAKLYLVRNLCTNAFCWQNPAVMNHFKSFHWLSGNNWKAKMQGGHCLNKNLSKPSVNECCEIHIFSPMHLRDLNSEDQSVAHRSHDPALTALRNCCLTACYDPWCELGNITTCGSINNKPSVVPMCLRKLNSSCSKCGDLFCANYPLTLLFKLTFLNTSPINTAPFTVREAGNSKEGYCKSVFSPSSHFEMC